MGEIKRSEDLGSAQYLGEGDYLKVSGRVFVGALWFPHVCSPGELWGSALPGAALSTLGFVASWKLCNSPL